MVRRPLGINTIVYDEQIKKGMPQSQLICKVAELGCSIIEVRREYFEENIHRELDRIRNLSKLYGIDVYYSVPTALFYKGKLTKILLNSVFDEALEMGAHNIKVPLGEFRGGVNEEFKKEICSMTEKTGISVTFENDGSKNAGRISDMREFVDMCTEIGLSVGTTFDVGNWLVQDQDVEEAEMQFHDAIRFLHLKNFVKVNNELKPALLNEGMVDFEAFTAKVPKNIPALLEYPCPENKLINEVEFAGRI